EREAGNAHAGADVGTEVLSRDRQVVQGRGADLEERLALDEVVVEGQIDRQWAERERQAYVPADEQLPVVDVESDPRTGLDGDVGPGGLGGGDGGQEHQDGEKHAPSRSHGPFVRR